MKNTIPETIIINDQNCSDKITIVESFNTFFASTSIEKQDELNIRTHHGSHFQDYLTSVHNCNFAFHFIDNNTTSSCALLKIEKIPLVKGTIVFLPSF